MWDANAALFSVLTGVPVQPGILRAGVPIFASMVVTSFVKLVLTSCSLCRLLSATDAVASERAADELKVGASMLDAQSLKESTAAADEIRARDAGLIGTSLSLSARDDVIEQTAFSASDFEYVLSPALWLSFR